MPDYLRRCYLNNFNLLVKILPSAIFLFGKNTKGFLFITYFFNPILIVDKKTGISKSFITFLVTQILNPKSMNFYPCL